MSKDMREALSETIRIAAMGKITDGKARAIREAWLDYASGAKSMADMAERRKTMFAFLERSGVPRGVVFSPID